MKILQVMWLGEIGGLEKYVLQLSTELTGRRYDVEMCIVSRDGPISKEAKTRGIITHILNLRNGFDIVRAFRFIRLLKENDYDVIHVHDRNFMINLILLVFYRGKKVFTEHGGELIGDKPQKRFFFYKLLVFQYYKIIANSEHIKKVLVGRGLVSNEKISLIYNGIEIDSSPKVLNDKIRINLNIATGKKVVGVIARMVPAKGVDLFIEVAKKISQVKEDFVFIIVGDGPMKSDYEKLAGHKSVHSDIRFLGWRTDVKDILSILDIYMFTSRWESFGISLVEAMAAGVPITGFDIPGANEILVNDETAILVRPYNTDELTKKVLCLASDKILRSRLVDNGRRVSNERYSIKINSDKILEVYKK